MKKIFLLSISILISTLASATDGNQVSAFKKQCDDLKKVIESFEKFKSIIVEEEVKTFQADKHKTAEDYNQLYIKNDSVFKWSKEIIELAEKNFENNPNDLYPQKAVQTVGLFYQDYFKAVSKDGKTINLQEGSIKINSEFPKVLDKYYQELGEIKNRSLGIIPTGSEIENDSTVAEEGKEQGITYDMFYLYLVGGVILIFTFFIVLIIISLNRINKRLDHHKKALGEINNPDINIKNRLEVVENWIDQHKSQNSSTNRKGPTTTDCVSFNEFNALSTNIQTTLANLSKRITVIEGEIARINHNAEISNTSETMISSPKAAVSKEGGNRPRTKSLFAQLQNNGTFKVYDENKQQAFFEIIPNAPGAGTGTFTLKSEFCDLLYYQ